ncbi:M15 family peptidase [Candidatus Pacearchaeota archaeon]|nr:M15 family peptidase [Candidatus Pacearchaeota archaeon]
MTFNFGKTSTERLLTCYRDIQAIMHEAIARSDVDISVVCGQRGEEDQEEAFADGNSKAHYGESPHNVEPKSFAVDVIPWAEGKGQWNNEELFNRIAVHILAANKKLLEEGIVSVQLRWGNDWDGDGIPVDKDPDERFKDMPHWEIKGWKDFQP